MHMQKFVQGEGKLSVTYGQGGHTKIGLFIFDKLRNFIHNISSSLINILREEGFRRDVLQQYYIFVEDGQCLHT